MTKEPTVAAIMEAYAQDAIDYSARLGVELDFSEESVREVEKVLTMFHDSIPKGQLSKLLKKPQAQQELDQTTKMYGAYIGEVLMKRCNGRWKSSSQAFPGKNVYTLELEGVGDIWPHMKVGKRLTDGADDNVWHYFLHILKR